LFIEAVLPVAVEVALLLLLAFLAAEAEALSSKR